MHNGSVRRHAPSVRLIMILLALVTLGSATACSVRPTTPVKDVELAIPEQPAPPTLEGGACIDTTGSMPKNLVQSAIDAVTNLVATWVPEQGNPQGASPASLGLDLTIRKVLGRSSLNSAGEIRHVKIPGVPAVIAKPEADADGYIALSHAWRQQSEAAGAQRADARRRAAEEAAAIRAASWSSGSSEVAGCLEALARTTVGPARRLLLLSDLKQTDPAQVGVGDFKGVHLLIVHVCDEARRCLDQQTQWTQDLGARGADVRFAPPERLVEAMTELFHPKEGG